MEKLDSGFRRNDDNFGALNQDKSFDVAARTAPAGMIPRSRPRLLFEDEHEDEDDLQKVNLFGLPCQ